MSNKRTKHYLNKFQDSANISDRKYQKVRKLANLPSNYQLNNLKKNMNKIFEVGENTLGFFNSPVEKISFAVKNFIKRTQISNSENINIKIGMDGLQITRTHRQILNVTFTIVNENIRATTSKGNYLLGKLIYN